MLDLETVIAPTADGLSIVSLAEMKKHMHISHSALDDQITAAILEAAEALHGRDGELNRTVFPMTLVRYLPRWPRCSRTGRYIRKIQLPYPPLKRVLAVTVDDGGSPLAEVDTANYIVRTDQLVGEIEFLGSYSFPTISDSPRAIGIVFEAGYDVYPHSLKRMVKIMAAHFIENAEATINEPRQMQINRMIELGYQWGLNRLKVPNAQDDWEP